MNIPSQRNNEMNLLNEQLARVRIRELEQRAIQPRPEVAEAIRLHRSRRRAHRWTQLARWAESRAAQANR